MLELKFTYTIEKKKGLRAAHNGEIKSRTTRYNSACGSKISVYYFKKSLANCDQLNLKHK